jgi:hypothetical protein
LALLVGRGILTRVHCSRTPDPGESVIVVRDHLYVEPADRGLIVLGSISVAAKGGIAVFDLSRANRLSFRFLEDDILLVDLRVGDMTGGEMCAVSNNHLKHSHLQNWPIAAYRAILS